MMNSQIHCMISVHFYVLRDENEVRALRERKYIKRCSFTTFDATISNSLPRELKLQTPSNCLTELAELTG